MRRSKSISYLGIIMILIAAVGRLLLPTLNSTILYGVIPALLLWRIITDNSIFKNKYIQIYTILIFWLAITCLSADDYGLCISSMRAILGGYMLSIIFFSLAASNGTYSQWIFGTYIVLLIATIYYLYTNGSLFSVDIDKGRLNDETVNANDIAYLIFYATIAVSIMIWNFFKNNKVFSITIYIIIILVALQFALLTASRQIIIMVLPFVFFSMYFKVFKGDSFYKHIIPILLTVLIAIALFSNYFSLYFDGSFLQQRMAIAVKTDDRAELIEEAIRVGFQYPILGVGSGNFVLYSRSGGFSHCSYTELFATSGMLGLFLFSYIVIAFIIEQYKRYVITNDKMFVYLLAVGVFWAIYNYLYAFYTSLWLIAFFFLLIGYSENLYKNYNSHR